MRGVVTIGLLAALFATLAVLYLAPPLDDFEPNNPYWNGLSLFSSEIKPIILEDLRELGGMKEASNYALLIIGPSEEFSRAEIDLIRDFLVNGGLLIIADEFGTGNQVLSGLGVGFRFNGSLLVDPLFKVRASPLPRVNSSRFGEIVLNYATIIEGSGYTALIESSPFSFLDTNLNLRYDEGEAKGPFPVAVERTYGGGGIVAISDSSLFLNAMMKIGDNEVLARKILGGRVALLDTSHWRPSLFSKAKNFVIRVSAVLQVPEVKYSLLIVTLSLISAVRIKPVRGVPDPVDETLKKHPDWDRELLARLLEEIGREG